jgi:predicted CDP-diglyceride synthetase/phosphatidate cytidylyltransferase
MLPMMLWVNIADAKKSSCRFFLPLIIIYVLMIPVYIIAFAAYLIMLAAPGATVSARAALMVLFRLPMLLCAAKGTQIHVDAEDSHVHLQIT